MTATLLPTGIQFPDNSIQTSLAGVKSIQSIFVYPKGSLTGDYGASRAVDVTISAVDTSKSFILHGTVVNSQGSYSAPRMLTVKFLNSTTIQLCVNTSYAVYNTRLQIVEFY